MTRPEDPGTESGTPLDPAAEAMVRRLLEEARATEPMPDQVTERLDHVLAGLHAERVAEVDARPHDGEDGAASVTSLSAAAARRRRSLAGKFVLAAAAVVVAGVGLGQVTGGFDRFGDGGDPSTSGTAESMDPAGEDSAARDPGTAVSGDGPQTNGHYEAGTGQSDRADSLQTAGVPVVREERLRADLTRLQTQRSLVDGQGLPLPCVDPKPAERAVTVLFAGQRAAAVYSPPVAGTQHVRVYVCSAPDKPVETVLLPVR